MYTDENIHLEVSFLSRTGKTKKETGKDISFDCFQQYADEERPTPLHLEMEWWLGVTTK